MMINLTSTVKVKIWRTLISHTAGGGGTLKIFDGGVPFFGFQ